MTTSKKRCPQCRKSFPTESMIRFGVQHFCTFEHAVAYANKKSTKEKGKKIKRADLRERKEKLKSIADLTREAQTAVNAYIRARDHGKPCISCQVHVVQKRGGTMDAGHYRSRGSAGHLRFNVLNIHSQCALCNRWQSGNVVDYRIALIKRIGIENVEKLESDNGTRRFTREYLKRIKIIFNKRARWYKKRRGL